MQVRIQRRGQWGARILLPKIEGPDLGHAFRCLKQLYLGVRHIRSRSPCQISKRGKQDRSRWQAVPRITQGDEGRERETASRRTASNDDLPGLSFGSQYPAIDREYVFYSCRKRMLWS